MTIKRLTWSACLDADQDFQSRFPHENTRLERRQSIICQRLERSFRQDCYSFRPFSAL
jgi:hypothetical protein